MATTVALQTVVIAVAGVVLLLANRGQGHL